MTFVDQKYNRDNRVNQSKSDAKDAADAKRGKRVLASDCCFLVLLMIG